MHTGITELLNDKTKKSKVKTETISQWLMAGSMAVNELITFAEKAKDSEKATCMEAIEYAIKQNPEIACEKVLAFVTAMLAHKAPRVKWESARVVGNIAHLFPTKLGKPIANLLANSEHEGTVVRWSAAFALGEILKLRTKHNKDLLPAIEAICESEQDNAIKKKYAEAIKKAAKPVKKS